MTSTHKSVNGSSEEFYREYGLSHVMESVRVAVPGEVKQRLANASPERTYDLRASTMRWSLPAVNGSPSNPP